MEGESPSLSKEESLEPTPGLRKAGLFSRRRWLNPVLTTHCDLILVAHSFCTGLIDATIFANYSVFVGMQTGNTIILALSTASLPAGQPYAYLTTIVSICTFLIGAFTTAQLSYRLGPLRRLTLTSNLLIQGLLIALSAILLSVKGIGIPTDNRQEHVNEVLSQAMIVAAIPPLAFENGMQIVTSKLMGIDEIPVNVITSLYAGLMSDKALLVWRKGGKWTWGWHTGDMKRSRRLAALAAIFGGALCAAWILRKGPGMILSLWLGAGIKICTALIAGMFLGEQDVEVDRSYKTGELK